MTDKVIPFPAKPETDAGRDEVMILLGKAAEAGLTRVTIFGKTAEGEPFRETNFNELEATGAHFNAALLYCTED